MELEGFAHELGNPTKLLVQIQKKKSEVVMGDIPPDNNTIENVAPHTSHRRAELAKSIDGIVIKQIAHLAVEAQLVIRDGLSIMFQTVEPETQDHHQIETAQGVLDTPVGGRRRGNPVDALHGGDLHAFEALLNDLVHLRRAVDLVARHGHGSRHFIGRVVAHGLLHRLQVHLQPRARVAIDGHRVEDQRVALVRSAQRHHDGLRLADVERLLPRLQRESQLVLGNDVLEGFEAALVAPHLQEQGVDHDARRESAVPGLFALEQTVVCLADADHRRGCQAALPGFLVTRLETPQRLG